MDLAEYERRRDEVRDRIGEVLTADPRVRAVWLSGSFGRGEADAWSDLDLHVAVADEAFPAILEERSALYECVGPPILIQAEMPSNSMAGARFQLVIYSGPVEVDWNIGPVGQAERPKDSLVLFDRVGIPMLTPPMQTAEERRRQADWDLTFFWAMAPIAVKYAGRGESQQAASQIYLMTGSLVSLWRLVVQPEGLDPHRASLNRPLGADLAARLPRLGWTIDPPAALEVIGAVCREVELLHPALAALGVSIPTAMPGETASLVDIAGAVVRQREPPVKQASQRAGG
jgi:predicted nucleotidyltransferase